MVGFKIASIILPFVGFAFCGSIPARRGLEVRDPVPWPTSYIALGDSFAAGIGAGRYTNSRDPAVRRCKRFDGSYPVQARALFPHVDDAHFRFEACSGDVVASIDGQLERLSRNRAQVITLSISGNDFRFGNVVKKCVYNWKAGTDTRRDAQCMTALDEAQQIVSNGPVWESYKQKVNKILDDVAVPDQLNQRWAVLVITGYTKFFGEATENDACSSTRFRIPNLPIQGNLMRVNVRQRMNTLVENVNNRIYSDIVSINTNRIRFVNIDDHFEGHRFCEKGRVNDPVGANDPNIWFISLGTTLQESSFTPDSNSKLEQEWDEWAQGLDSKAGGGVAPGKLRETSCFHPKAAGHAETAKKIQQTVVEWGSQNGPSGTTPPSPPPLPCFRSNAENLPEGIVVSPGQNQAVGSGQVVDPNGLLYKIREGELRITGAIAFGY
jgi:lysophospholipase L1-like esterase